MGKSGQSIIFMGNFSFPKGMAASKRIKHFCDGFVRAGDPVRIIMIRQGRLKESDKIAAGTHDGIPFTTIGLHLRPNWKMLFYFPWMILEGVVSLWRYKKASSTNYLFLYGGFNLENFLIAAFAKWIGYKIIVDIVEDYTVQDEHFLLLGRVKNWSSIKFDKLNLSFAHAVVVISHVLLNKYRTINKISSPIALIPISASVREVPLLEEFHQPIRITYAGSFAKKDGIEHLIEAFRKVNATHPNTKLSLIGMGKSLPQYINQFESEKCIEFPGAFFGEHYYNFLDQSDILCVPRIDIPFAHAGFPYKLGEYLATGKPVVVSDTGDVKLYLTDKSNAMIVRPGSQEQLYSAFLYLIEDPPRAFQIGRNGLKVCENEFHPHINYLKLREVMTSIL